MKLSISLLVLLPVIAFANPFDGFVGEYKVSSELVVTSSDAADCARIQMDRLSEVKIRKGDYGFKNTHVVTLVRGGMYLSYPIAEYYREYGPTNSSDYVVYAKTTGDENSAKNERGVKSPNTSKKFVIALEKQAGETNLKMTTEGTVNSTTTSCVYEVDLEKIN